jgi:hypothetical protein
MLINNLRTANRIIIVAGILLIATAFVIANVAGVFDKKGYPFVDAMPETTAFDNIDDYRDSWTLRPKTEIVMYKESDLLNYIQNILPDLKSTLPGLPTNCEWRVGFYTMRRPYPRADSKSRLDFLVVPTLYDTITGQVYDFRDPANSARYRRSGTTSRTQCLECIGYDAGHLYP